MHSLCGCLDSEGNGSKTVCARLASVFHEIVNPFWLKKVYSKRWHLGGVGFFFEDRVWFESTECVCYHRFLKHENLMQVCGSIWRGTRQQ